MSNQQGHGVDTLTSGSWIETQTNKMLVVWPKGFSSSLLAISSAYKVSVGGTSYETYWEEYGPRHRDGSIYKTYALWRMSRSAGSSNPTAPQHLATVVAESNTVSPPSYVSWLDELDITLDYTDDDPANTNTYSFNLGDFARDSGNADRTYNLESTNGARYLTYSGWTGNGSRGHPTDPLVSFSTGCLRVWGEIEHRTGDNYLTLDLWVSNEAAWGGGANAPDGVTDPTRIAPPAERDCQAHIAIDRTTAPMKVTVSHASTTVYSAPSGVADFGTGASPLGDMAPDSGGWRMGGLGGLGYGEAHFIRLVISDVSAAHAQQIAKHWDAFIFTPTWQTALSHRRQQDLDGTSLIASGYGIPAKPVAQSAIDAQFLGCIARKDEFFANQSTDPTRTLGAQANAGSGSGNMRHIGHLRDPYSKFVVAGSTPDLYVSFHQVMREYTMRGGLIEVEALKGLDTLFNGAGDNSKWINLDGIDQYAAVLNAGGVGLGIFQRTGSNTKALYNGSPVTTSNPDTRRAAKGWTRWNLQHAGAWPLYWVGLMTGSRAIARLAEYMGYACSKQIHDRINSWKNPRGVSLRSQGRGFAYVPWIARQLSQESSDRDNLYRHSAQWLAATIDDSVSSSTTIYWSRFMSSKDGNNPIATLRGLRTVPSGPEAQTKDINENQCIPWQVGYAVWGAILWAFEKPEGSSEIDYREQLAKYARVLSYNHCRHLLCIRPDSNLPTESREEQDDWYADIDENRRLRGDMRSQHGLYGFKSREVDEAAAGRLTASGDPDPGFTQWVVDANPRGQGQTAQNIMALYAALSFRTNIEQPGFHDRVQVAIERLEREFPELADGTGYFGGAGLPLSQLVGGGGGTGIGIEPVPPLPIEGDDPPDPEEPEVGAFAPLASGTPMRFQAGLFMNLRPIWQTVDKAVMRFATGPGNFQKLTRSTAPGGGDPVQNVRTHLGVPLDEEEDVRCEIVADAPTTDYGEAVLTGPGLVPVYHGMGVSDEPVEMQPFRGRLYITNGIVRPVEYSEHGAALAGVTPPSGEINFEVKRKSMGLRDQGATFFTGDTSVANGLDNVTGYIFTEDDVGKWVLVPSEAGFAADGPDVLTRITAVVDADTVTVSPAILAGQVGTSVSMWMFPPKDATTIAELLDALSDTTPYSDKRPNHRGANPSAAGESNALCLSFYGQNAIECKGLSEQAAQERVIDFKGYFKPRRVSTGGLGRILLWDRRSEDNKSTWDLSIVDDGKLEFRFWDVSLDGYRSIKTVGICVSIGEWYYIRLRYKFKQDGGWQPDDRHLLRNDTLVAGAASLPMAGNYRDYLACWALNNNNPADPFLVVAGTHNAWTATPDPVASNSSREIGNTGYLLSDPWIGPRKNDPGFNQGGLATERACMFEVTRGATAFQFVMKAQSSGGAGMTLPRWMSSNRDEPWDDAGTTRTQVHQAIGNTNGAYPSTASLVGLERTILCYIYGPDGGAEFSTPRILALTSVGTTDIGNVSAAGSETSSFFLSNSTALGADGLAENVAGGDISGAGDYIIAFAFPNGSNHASQATGNTKPIPTLLVQGENPVGTSDSPTPRGGVVRIGGARRGKETDQTIINFRGEIDDVGFGVYDVDDTEEVYTADMLPPDVHFNGPVDPRLGSLPALAFDSGATTETGITVTALANASWSSRLDSLAGGRLSPAAAGEPQIAASIVGYDRRATTSKASGLHQVAVTFWDPARQHESPPSRIGTVTFQSQPDEAEPDSERSVEVTALPSSAERDREVWRRIYATSPDGSEFFLMAEVRDNETSKAKAVIEPSMYFDGRIDFAYRNPPPCRFLMPSESRMFYGGLADETARTLVAWSDPNFPWQVPGFSNRDSLEAADGGIITGLAYKDGRIYVLSRAAIFAGEDLGETVRFRRVQASTGAVSHRGISEVEDAIFFPSERGIFAFDGIGRVQELSSRVEPTYRALDPVGLRRSQSAYSRRRGQYYLSCAPRGGTYATEVLTCEVRPGQGVTWSREVHSSGISSLYSGADTRTDEREVYMGTPSGFVGQLDAGDRPRGQYDGSALYGVHEATVLGGTGYEIGLANPDFDDALDGISGVPYVITRTEDGHTTLIDRGFCWRFDGSHVHTMTKVSEAIQAGDTFLLGGWAMQWHSKAFDFRVATDRVRLEDVDLTFEKKDSDVLELDVVENFGSDAAKLLSVPLAKGFELAHIGASGGYLKLRLLKLGRRPFSIYNVALRAKTETNRGGGRGAST